MRKICFSATVQKDPWSFGLKQMATNGGPAFAVSPRMLEHYFDQIASTSHRDGHTVRKNRKSRKIWEKRKIWKFESQDDIQLKSRFWVFIARRCLPQRLAKQIWKDKSTTNRLAANTSHAKLWGRTHADCSIKCRQAFVVSHLPRKHRRTTQKKSTQAKATCAFIEYSKSCILRRRSMLEQLWWPFLIIEPKWNSLVQCGFERDHRYKTIENKNENCMKKFKKISQENWNTPAIDTKSNCLGLARVDKVTCEQAQSCTALYIRPRCAWATAWWAAMFPASLTKKIDTVLFRQASDVEEKK